MAGINEAYDLELFQPRQPRLVALKDSPKMAKDKQKRSRRQKVLNVIVYLSAALVAIGLVAYFITCNVQLTEMNRTISEYQTELSILQSERVRLESELASKTSAGQIDQYAQLNGMQPAENSQIYYIHGDTEDLVEMADSGGGWLRQAFEAFIALF